MKAIVCTQYGSADVLKLREVDQVMPKDNEVRIKVHATTVTAGDIRVRAFQSPLLLWIPMRLVLGLRKPRKPVLGVELAGVVEAVGKDVKRYKVGDSVFALTGMKFGGHAEYACLSENSLMEIKPEHVSYEESASILFGGTTAIYFLGKGNIQQGQKVLIYGASGTVGTAAVQLAKYFGAEVTGVCSGANLEMVKSLGADRVVDYTKEDFASQNEHYDLIFDAVGKCSKSRCKNALTPGGSYVTVDGQGIAKVLPQDLLFIKELMEQGNLRSVIDRTYPLEQIPEAHRYVEKGHKKGSVVIQVS
ncbi:NAD(P)-dependent alcohol dehydrogenase [Paenibacillus zeisoli]|uniref:NAD(P)-dependent alcohol dehydrogenase n=1 Tax=Paenibacillus zeisoli TaxID=2496267 RepID=A0A433X666_9BACL|nr:NAD(P)-dependent alcohol dehydrogenase [Paenibacillus zeisoli]RUT29620.1 NAD(P)-dependent alcohol dehydrogenase [Paenibacillus zeisoli]